MSCKYCELKRRKDDDVEWIAGEDWESESDDGGYIHPNDDGFEMLVYYDARYACTAVENIKYCPFCGGKLTMPKEPLIKDEKIRKAVRAWADAIGVDDLFYCIDHRTRRAVFSWPGNDMAMELPAPIEGLATGRVYTIDELCGEERE